MSLKNQAAQVRRAGYKNTKEDSLLAHISPKEAALLKKLGGSGKIDPTTGLPHFDENGDGGAGGSMGSDSGDSGGFGGSSNGGYDGNSGMGNGYGDVNGSDSMSDSFGNNVAATGWAGDGSFANDSGFDVGSIDHGLGSMPNSYDGSYAPEGSLAAMMESFDKFRQTTPGKIGMGLLGMTPAGMAINAGLALRDGKPGAALGAMVGGVPGAIASMASNGIMGNNISSQAGSTMGGIIGNGIAPGLGGIVGSQLGGWAGGLAGKGGVTGPAASGDNGGTMNGIDFGGLATGLGGLYSAYQNNQNASQAAGVMQQQTDQLSNIYGPNSPYAAQLRQQLERKDAAGGRRSQYGPREVELQARLADAASRNAPNVLAANQAAYGFNQNSTRATGQGFSTAMNLAKQSGLLGWGQKQLGDMWNGGGSGNGNAGYADSGGSYNNPSAYSAPEPAYPSANGAASYGSSMNNASSDGGNFWDNW